MKTTIKFHSKVLSETRFVITQIAVVPCFSIYYQFHVVPFTGINKYCLELARPDNQKIRSKMQFLWQEICYCYFLEGRTEIFYVIFFSKDLIEY